MTMKSTMLLLGIIVGCSFTRGDWTRHLDPNENRFYFFCALRGESNWDVPGPISCPSSKSTTFPTITLRTTTMSFSEEFWNDCSAEAQIIYAPADSISNELRRAWRSLARMYHPDKVGGSTSAFTDSKEASLYLSSPLRFLAYRALHMNKTEPTSPSKELLQITSASAVLEDRDGWPYIRIDAHFQGDLSHASPFLTRGSSFQVALSSDGVSTIEYKGDEDEALGFVKGQGGYDVCCGFIKNGTSCVESSPAVLDSFAELKNNHYQTDGEKCVDVYDESNSLEAAKTADERAITDREGGVGKKTQQPLSCLEFARLGYCSRQYGEWYRENCRKSCGLCGSDLRVNESARERGSSFDKEQKSDDCAASDSYIYSHSEFPSARSPFQESFIASLAKPLHLKRAGRWAAVLLLLSPNLKRRVPKVAGCLSTVFNVEFTPVPPLATDINNDASSPFPSAQEYCREPSSKPASSVPTPTNANKSFRSPLPRFERYSSGLQCQDGGDILEGPLDAYTDCDSATRLCRKSRKCSEKCKRNKRCYFYTTFQNGWCQLSSRCSTEIAAADISAETFSRIAAS